MTTQKIFVLGAGAWGTALAAGLVRDGKDVRLWAREKELVEPLSTGIGNPVFLKDVELPPIPTTNALEDVASADIVLSVVPAQFTRSVLEQIAPVLGQNVPVILCAKGIERDTLKTMAEVAAETLPNNSIGVLSGPSFARDVARGLPTAVTLAVQDPALGRRLMNELGRPDFRPYLSTDLIGAEIGGATKNVLAIACGIVDGLDLGKSAHAALIARGFAEMTRLGVAVGGKAETLAGLCGLGDLVLTCSSPESRNMSFGRAIGQGEPVKDILERRNAVTEGAATAPALIKLARDHGVEMPICEAVSKIIDGEVNVDQASHALLSRPYKEET